MILYLVCFWQLDQLNNCSSKCLCRAYCVSGPVLSTSPAVTHLIFTTTLSSRCCYYPHFLDRRPRPRKTKKGAKLVTVVESEFDPRSAFLMRPLICFSYICRYPFALDQTWNIFSALKEYGENVEALKETGRGAPGWLSRLSP